ncbi:Ferritin light chain 1 [Tupaia chinensis]|uniref:Ferritin n=1 Tax=Tupaia chinensis TaxID=246437 RepID=L9KQA0_TUPCH|nr:Ferritin light chain 1 [Tupaia chinensis]
MIRNILLMHAGRYGCRVQTTADSVSDEAELLVRANPYLWLPSNCGPTMTSQIHQNYSPKVEAAVNHMVNQHPLASYTYVSLGFCFSSEDMVLECVGHFYELAKKKHKGAEHFLKTQNHHGGHTLFQDVQKPSQDEWSKTLEAIESALALK